jgi:hypothetical protein
VNAIKSLNRVTQRLILACGLVIGGSAGIASGQVAVTTHHNDNGRTGQNLTEPVLNTSNVNVNTFGKLFSRAVDGQIYAQPLYVPDLSVAGQIRNVVYVATQNDTVYAFDADEPAASSPLWQANLGTPVPSTDVDPACADITPQVGITSTPVIDTNSSTIYVVAKTKNTTDSSYHFNIHALDLITGTEKFGGPTGITAQVPGTGVESVSGTVTLDPLQQFNRPGLLLLNGIVYVAFGSACETPPWHGWILGYSASTLQQVAVLNTTPNGSDGGIWGGGQGLLADSDNNIYVMTGNGTFDPTTGDYGDSILKISTASGLSIVDYFTPTNQADLDAADLDLGSGGPMALPGTNLIVGAGKDGVVRVLDTTNLGQFSATTNNNVQNFQGTAGLVWTGLDWAAVFQGAPIYWNSPNHGPVIYIWGGNDFLKAYQFVNGAFQTTAVSQSTIFEAPGYSNSVPLSLSANGNQAGTGIVWGSGALSRDATRHTVAGILRAFDATDLTNELWDSKQNAARDDVGNYAKFSPPTVANGKVYQATFSSQLAVYGLLAPADFTLDLPSLSATVTPGESATYKVMVTSENGFNRAVSFTCSGLPAGGNCLFSPAWVNPIVGPATTTLIVTTASSTPKGTSSISITASSGSLQHPTTLSLTVASSNPALTVSAFSPTSGTANGGTGVTITGTGFLAGATVKLGGTTAANVTVTSSTTITATTPAHTAGTVDVVVTNSDGQSYTLRGGYIYTSSTSGTINFVQVNYKTSNPSASSVSVAYPAAQMAGNLNVVVVGWNDTASSVSSIVDSQGNTYTRAVGPTTGTALSQSIYYARNIAGGSNTVTVTFNQTAAYPDVRVMEYSGANTSNPLDVTAGSSGTGMTGNSGSATTTAANELIFGAGMTFDIYNAAGNGFTNWVITNFGDITEDKGVTHTGSYNATAGIRSSAAWVMQLVTFRASGQSSSNPAPSVAGIGPNSGPASGGTAVTITGTGFQSGATVSLGGMAVSNVVVGSSTSITATTPAHAAGAVNVVVTNSDTQSGILSNGYTYIAPADFTITASALSPATVVAAGSATSTIVITPLNGFGGTLSLSCSSIVPAVTPAPTCAFAPSSVTGSGTSTLTVRTTAAAQGSLAPRSRGVFYAMWLPVGGLLVLGAGLTSRRQRFLCFVFECVLFSSLILLAACGGGSSSFGGSASGGGTPAGVYTVTISASGSVTHTATVTLTVK